MPSSSAVSHKPEGDGAASSSRSHKPEGDGAASSRQGWRFFWLLLGLVLLELLAHERFLTLTQPGWTVEKFEYEQIAQHLTRGEGYRYDLGHTTYRSYGPPLYPVICAFLYSILWPSPWVVVGFQILCRVGLGLVVWRIAKRIVSSPPAMAAGLWAALHPGIAHCSLAKLHPLPLDALLIAASVLLYLWADDRPSLPRGIAVGAVLGVAAHTRETSLVLLPVGLLWLLRHRGAVAGSSQRCAVALVITMAVALAPWTIRNYLVHGRWIFMRTDAGWNWWLGNHPGSSGGALTPSGTETIDAVPQARQWLNLPETDQMDRFLKQGKGYLQARPLDALAGWGQRLIHFWWFSPQTGLLYPPAWRVIYQGYYGLFLLLCALGLYSFSRSPSRACGRPLSLLLLTCLAISLAQSLFYVEGRHRWPLEVLLMPLATQGIGWRGRGS